MKGLKRVYLTAVMAVMLTVTGCGADSDQRRIFRISYLKSPEKA